MADRVCGQCAEWTIRRIAEWGLSYQSGWCHLKQQEIDVDTPACEHFRERKSDGE